MSQAPPHTAASAAQQQYEPHGAKSMDVVMAHEAEPVSLQASDNGASNTVRLSKVLHVEIKGSLSGFSQMGPEAATWKVVDGKQVGVFGMDDMSTTNFTDAQGGAGGSNMMLNADLSVASNALRNVTVTKATLLQLSLIHI